MKKIISLCVFGKDESHWKMTLQAIINNRIVYPNFIVRLHTSIKDNSHPLIKAFQNLAAVHPFFELVVVNKSYVNLEATMWRMLPLWDTSVDIFFCRDVDAYPTTMEVKSAYYFLNHDEYDIHGIRSYISHGGVYLMAGLCGFKKERFKHLPGIPSYEHYQKYTYHISWGGDQTALKEYFYKYEGTQHLKTLDTVLGDCPKSTNNPFFNPCYVSIEEYQKTNISFIHPAQIIKWGDDGRVSYEGHHQYFDAGICRQSFELDCEISKDIKTIVYNNTEVKQYLGL